MTHHPATLTSYLGLICVISTEGSLLCFNSDLQPLISRGVQIGEETPTLCPGDGYLYLAAASGVHGIDLIALLQSESFENVVLTKDRALSPVSVMDDSAFCVVSGEGPRFVCWGGQQAKFSIALPGLRFNGVLLPPVLLPGYALIAERGGTQVHVLDLDRKELSASLNCKGTIVFAAAAANGMALLLETEMEGRQRREIALATPMRVSVAVPALESDVTWIAVSQPDRYLWGDGSRCFLQTSKGTRPAQVQGNIGVVQVHEGRGWALLETAEGTSAITIDLADARVFPKSMETGALTDFVVSGNRLIASNGLQIRSISLL